jgi:hypothetical protein
MVRTVLKLFLKCGDQWLPLGEAVRLSCGWLVLKDELERWRIAQDPHGKPHIYSGPLGLDSRLYRLVEETD